MVPPGPSVSIWYWPVRCNATPHAEIAPVQSVSACGDASCWVGSGMLVPTIQSALPAVSALESSNSTRCAVAAGAAVAACGTARLAPGACTAAPPASSPASSAVAPPARAILNVVTDMIRASCPLREVSTDTPLNLGKRCDANVQAGPGGGCLRSQAMTDVEIVAEFEITGWDQTVYHEGPGGGPKLARATVHKTFRNG